MNLNNRKYLMLLKKAYKVSLDGLINYTDLEYFLCEVKDNFKLMEEFSEWQKKWKIECEEYSKKIVEKQEAKEDK